MSTQSPLPQNDPMLIAFQKLKHTPEYKNAVNWTIKAENESQADGELWFGFAAGWNAHAEHASVQFNDAIPAMKEAYRQGRKDEADHTAAIREKARELVAYCNSKIVVDSKLYDLVTALKAELEDK